MALLEELGISGYLEGLKANCITNVGGLRMFIEMGMSEKDCSEVGITAEARQTLLDWHVADKTAGAASDSAQAGSSSDDEEEEEKKRAAAAESRNKRKKGVTFSDAATDTMSPAAAAPAGAPAIDPSVVNELVSMGFSQNAARKAAAACNGVSEAVDWCFAHSQDADFDSPAESATGGGGSSDPSTALVLAPDHAAASGPELDYKLVALLDKLGDCFEIFHFPLV